MQKQRTYKEKNKDLNNIIQDKRDNEKRVLEKMIHIYCKGKKHNEDGICRDCQELINYSNKRVDLCPFMETKTFCSNCKVHCYRGDMRERIREVMRYSGPRIILYHPILALKHIFLDWLYL